ncbi:class I SAM-dependent methyltransferase [Bacillus sp. REN16]|uniref:class I SAM-dependent methyltransferase n=1 Tax=Bacillus sp. REN16 TaxID=2887296 RepID=UPI001E3D4161|nr:class I SAM-dependent methyltransferase [Bacillus sp. REN16]MCC3358417.1 class I SAM-dependent methyltransferase [Bacillus sp. REN16]
MTEFKWHEEAEKQWDGRADFWSKQSQAMWNSGSRSTIIPFFSQFLQNDAVILDAGCGDGYGSFLLAKRGFQVVGADISAEMIEKANNRSQYEGLSFIQDDLTSLPFEDETFSGIMAINSIEWTEKPLGAINEIKRVTKPGGILCAGLLGPTAGPRQNAYPRLYGKKVIQNTMMPWEFEQLVSENGWKAVDGQPVYKDAVNKEMTKGLPRELKQALSFMWVFILKKN